jgi:hypothetical protein
MATANETQTMTGEPGLVAFNSSATEIFSRNVCGHAQQNRSSPAGLALAALMKS